MNIWELSKAKLLENKQKAAELEQKLDDENSSGNDQNYLSEIRRRHEAHIVLTGNRKSGKSSFIMNFVERREELKESVGLEYSYARRTRGNVKDVANLWELGGGHSVTQLLSVPITVKNIEVTSIIVLLDMTKLDETWTTVETIMESIQSLTENICRQDTNLQTRLHEKMRIRMAKYPPEDIKMCNPCAIPLTLVASKYDEYQNFESEKRRNLSQFLRFLAYYYGANLMMYSAKMEQFPKVVKNAMSHFAFGTVAPQGYFVDHNKPLFVQCGFDSFEKIGMPPSAENFMGTSSSPFHMWKDSFTSIFPQKSGVLDTDGQQANSKSDPMTDPTFREPNIDNLVEIKRKELENHVRQKRDREAAEARAAERISKINVK